MRVLLLLGFVVVNIVILPLNKSLAQGSDDLDDLLKQYQQSNKDAFAARKELDASNAKVCTAKKNMMEAQNDLDRMEGKILRHGEAEWAAWRKECQK